jgi:hypothetical protein
MVMEISQQMMTAQINTVAGVGREACFIAAHGAAVLSAR